MALLLASLCAGGCAHLETTQSGYLSSYGRLAPVSNDHRRLSYVVKGGIAPAYRSMLIEPTTVRLAPGQTDGVKPDEIVRLSARCDQALRAQFKGRYRFVDKPAPDTLRVRAAITGVDTSNPGLNVIAAAILWPIDNGGVSMELEVEDAGTDQQLAALVGHSEGTPFQVVGSFSRFGHAFSGIDYWVKQLALLIKPKVAASVPQVAKN